MTHVAQNVRQQIPAQHPL